MIKKQEIAELAKNKNFDKLIELALKDSSKVIRYLVRLTYTKDEILRWHAIESLGVVSGAIADRDPAEIRELIRKFLWSMTEESGNVNHHAPEAVAEIIYNRPKLFADLAPMMITASIDEEVFQPGMLWAVGRLAGIVDYILEILDRIITFLDDKNPLSRGYAAWALGEIYTARDVKEKLDYLIQKLTILKEDKNIIPIYINSHLYNKSIGEIADLSILKIKRAIL
ncbi:HEAT repeat domain-containing protein [Peptococcaceae bacterium]|nr:HEAT repeat domain-containing protein [Desulfotomaculum sp.]MCL0043519.1 HEAT repeat domain-containing protein [Peptococcaceae bacterium]MCL0062948.1 HEAT repeat domain-containing protein [Peptococcaceae bacterium]